MDGEEPRSNPIEPIERGIREKLARARAVRDPMSDHMEAVAQGVAEIRRAVDDVRDAASQSGGPISQRGEKELIERVVLAVGGAVTVGLRRLNLWLVAYAAAAFLLLGLLGGYWLGRDSASAEVAALRAGVARLQAAQGAGRAR